MHKYFLFNGGSFSFLLANFVTAIAIRLKAFWPRGSYRVSVHAPVARWHIIEAVNEFLIIADCETILVVWLHIYDLKVLPFAAFDVLHK